MVKYTNSLNDYWALVSKLRDGREFIATDTISYSQMRAWDKALQDPYVCVNILEVPRNFGTFIIGDEFHLVMEKDHVVGAYNKTGELRSRHTLQDRCRRKGWRVERIHMIVRRKP